MKWRFFQPKAYSPVENMAIDEVCVRSVLNGSSPIFRLYDWSPAGVSLGVNQHMNDINKEFCKTNNIPVVRRITGGRAVFHAATDLTYAVIAPLSLFPEQTLDGAYNYVCSFLCETLKQIGLQPEMINKNDILVNNKKISGNSSKHIQNIYLQHGTIIFDIDHELQSSIFKVSPDLFREHVTSITDQAQIKRIELYRLFKHIFFSDKRWNPAQLAIEEHNQLKILKEKYAPQSIWTQTSGNTSKGVCYTEF